MALLRGQVRLCRGSLKAAEAHMSVTESLMDSHWWANMNLNLMICQQWCCHHCHGLIRLGHFFYLYHSTTMIVNSAFSVLCLEYFAFCSGYAPEPL